MKIVTINLNGIRSAARKGFFEWLAALNADVICMQEVKAQEIDLQDECFRPAGYHAHFHFAEKKGYSGVGIYTRHQPQQVVTGLGWDVADQEGRYVAIKLDNLWVASLYLPSGTSGEERQAVKFEFLDKYAAHLQTLLARKEEYVICGDWNIAHTKMDLKNWRSNQTHSGFLPEERAWMDKLFNEFGFIDGFRVVNTEPDQYTWWSNRGRAWDNNTGWRIDYQIVTPGLKSAIQSASIFKEKRFSDHAPLVMEYSFSK